MTTGVLAAPPILQFWLNNGTPAAGGTVLTQVGGVNAATYADSGLTTPLPNPIPLNSRGEVSNAAGASSQCFLTPNTVYTFILSDAGGNQVWSASYVNGIQITLTQSTIGAALYPQTAAEAAAGVVPTNLWYPPYNVLRYGAKGDGVTDDTAAFNTAGSIRRAIQVPDTGSTYVLSSQVTGLFYTLDQPRFTTNYQRIGLVSKVGTPLDENNSGVVGSFQGLGAVLMIGDSITQGTGSSTYVNSYAWAVGRSLMNSMNEGVFADNGSAYHRILQMSSFITSPGVTNTGGTIIAAGTWNSRLNLTGANTLAITQREIKTLFVAYDATASAGATFTIALNGTVIYTLAVSGSGLKMSGPLTVKANGYLTRLSDVITIAVTAGTLQVCGVYDVKASDQEASQVSIGGQSGYAYQDYNTAAAVTELTFFLCNPTVPQRALIVCNLGTNNMYNAGKALSPSATVTQISQFLSAMVTSLGTAGVTSIQLAISVPPRSNEALFPMILAQYRYEDYVRAIIGYALSNNITLIRHDQSALSSGSYYADGLHPNDAGHTIFAQTTLRSLGVKFDRFFKSVDYTIDKYLTNIRTDAAIPMNSTWGPFGGLAGFAARAHLVAGNLILSGVVIPNGSASAQIGALPAAFIPDSQDRYVLLNKNVSGGVLGTTRLLISHTTGALTLDAVPSTDVSLDGVCIPLNKFIES